MLDFTIKKTQSSNQLEDNESIMQKKNVYVFIIGSTKKEVLQSTNTVFNGVSWKDQCTGVGQLKTNE